MQLSFCDALDLSDKLLVRFLDLKSRIGSAQQACSIFQKVASLKSTLLGSAHVSPIIQIFIPLLFSKRAKQRENRSEQEHNCCLSDSRCLEGIPIILNSQFSSENSCKKKKE